MFKFVSTTFINGDTYVDGTPAWFSIKEGAINYSNAEAAEKTDMPTELTGNTDEVSLTINHNNKFIKGNVVKITRAKFIESKSDVLTLNVPDLEAGIYRLHFYIRSVENADPLYANDFVYKGRPLDIEFSVKEGDTAEKIAKAIEKVANKWILLLFDNNKILKIKANGSKVVIKATSEFQRIHQAELQNYNEAVNPFAYDGTFVPLYTLEDKDVFEYEMGNVSFGYYTDLIKSVRQATNSRWMMSHPLRQYQMDEMPNINGKYWQYVITQCTERPEMQGTSVLGQYNKSITTHVVFVEDGVKDAFDAALKDINEIEEVKNKPTAPATAAESPVETPAAGE